jgi:hypothetical protein
MMKIPGSRFSAVTFPFLLTAIPGSLHGQNAILPDPADIPREEEGWTLFNRVASVAKEGDRTVVTFDGRPGDGAAWLNGLDFQNGTIELLIRGRNSPGRRFVGLAFRGVDDETYDAVYFRPFNFVADNELSRSHMVQYISHPTYTWSKLREEHTGKYESTLPDPPDPDRFFRARIVVRKPRVEVFVNDDNKPCLVIDELTDRDCGRIGLWMGNNSDGSFAEMVVRPEGG